MKYIIISGLIVTDLMCVGAPAWAAPCAQKDAAERIICQMGTAKTRAEADALSGPLGKLGATSLPLIKKVLKKSKNGQVRSAVACSVESIGPKATALILDLVRVLNDTYVPVWLCALRGVAAIGPPAMAAIPQVVRSLDHKDIDVQIQAVKTMSKLWPTAPGSIPALVKILDGKRDKRLKYGVARILAKYGALADVAKPALRKAMFAPDAKLQGLAVAVVASMVPASWTEIPSLIKLSSEKKHPAEVRLAAAAALTRMGKYGKKHEEALKKALKSEGAPKKQLEAALKAMEAK